MNATVVLLDRRRVIDSRDEMLDANQENHIVRNVNISLLLREKSVLFFASTI